MVTLFWVLGISLSISFLCSILEAVLLSVTPAFAGVMQEDNERVGRHLSEMLAQIDEPIAAILTLNTIAHTVGAAMGGALALEAFGQAWMGVFSAALTLAILLFSEIVPKTLGATYWKQLARPTSYVLKGMILTMKPVLIPLSLFNRLITPRGEKPGVSRAEIEVLADIGRREGTLDEDEWQVMTNVIRLDEVTLGEVMTPRTDMVGVPAKATVEEAKNVMLDEGHLRLPVFDGSLDTITGILLARDLWRADRDGVTSIDGVVRPVEFAPSGKRVEDLIPEMKDRRDKMVIVVDEFGGTAGLVTLEDLIEEIIGEIQDEHEGDEPTDFEDLEDGDVRIWGGTPLRELNDRLDLALPEDQFDTVGGFLFGELNRVGQVGDVVRIAGASFAITQMHGRRIAYVRFSPSA